MFEGETMKNFFGFYPLVLLLCGHSALVHAGKTVVIPGSSAAYLFLPVAKTTVVAATEDKTAPTTNPWDVPTASIKGTEANFTATIDEAGYGCFTVQLKATAAPTVDKVKDGSTAVAAGAKGCQSMSAGTSTTFIITGLSEKTDYTVYFIARDNATPTNNWQTAYVTKEFKTLDVTPPTTSAVTVTSTSSTNASFTARITEDGYGCYKVLPSATAPTVDDVFKAECTGQTMAAATDKTFGSIGGLTAGTTYYIYFLARDNATPTNNWQGVFQLVKSFTATAPCVCYTDTNSNHKAAGRANQTPPYGNFTVVGSGEILGAYTQTALSTKICGSGTNYKKDACP